MNITTTQLASRVFLLAFFLSFGLSAAEQSANPDLNHDLRIVRDRLLAPLYRVPDMGRVRQLLDALRSDGSWPSIDYQSQHRSGWRTSRHLGQVSELARACVSPDSPLRGDERLTRGVAASLDYWLVNDFQNPNWWHNQIGVPQSLAPILLLWDEHLTEAQRKKGIEILSRADLSMTGQNLVWLAEIVAARGILERNAERVAAAYGRISDEIRVTTEEGIQPDFSFHQHGACLYSHGYGAAFASDCSATAVLLSGTTFAFPPEKIDLLTRLILDGHQWLARGQTPDVGAIGRQTARANQSVSYLSRVAGNMLQLPTGREQEFEALELRTSGRPAPPLVGNRHFWRSDTMAHHRPGYYTSARMYSRRIVNTDGPSNGEGLRNHHIADGCNLLLRSGREYWNISPVWDWQKVPGTTVELTGQFAGSPRRRGETEFVGGVSDGTYGAAVFDLKRDRLAARKAWFFFDDQYVCLGAGITCDSTHPVITTVNQCLLQGPMLVSDGSTVRKLDRGAAELSRGGWVYHDQVAYVFPQAGSLHVRAEQQTGSWHLIASEQPDRPTSDDVFSLWLEHGTRPAGGTYAYVVVPGVPPPSAAADVQSPDVEILRNDAVLQAVRQVSLSLTGAVFYEPGTLKISDELTLEVDRACLALLHQAADEFTVTLANPRNAALEVTVNVVHQGNTYQQKIDLPEGLQAGSSVTRTVRVKSIP